MILNYVVIVVDGRRDKQTDLPTLQLPNSVE